ncbi:hypothetical protein [Aeromonas sp. MrichA-1]|nr:hypothetical protein [Aeromonas sp. MrichA-1]MBP4081593.1 hypothetical protein [Aeromonas sp. MrichA-1]
MSHDVALNIVSDDEWKEQGLMQEQDGADNPIENEALSAELEKDFQ